MIYDYKLIDRKGNVFDLASLRNKVVIIVNTATGCGFTPHYTPLEEMYKKYHDMGLEIIDIPCNQFGGQAPGSDEEIHEFCSLHFNTTFPQMKKSDVNGPNALPLYEYLKSQKGFEGFGEGETANFMKDFLAKMDPNYEKTSDIKWNFTKFVIDREGKIVARFEPTTDMAELEKCVASLI